MTISLRRHLSTVVLLLAGVVFLGVVCSFGFTNSEDEGLITTNPNLNPPTLHGLWNHWTHPHVYLYIPVTYTMWWVLALLGHVPTPDENGATLNPWVFHSANLLVHLVTCVLVLNLLRRLIGREGPALLGALLFALHPIQVEAVAWTTGMKDVLCGAFSFAALLLYVQRIQDADTATRSRSRWIYLAATFALLLALLSKPAGCVVPLMAFTIDALILRRPLRAVVRSLWPWFVITLPFLILAPLIQPASEVVAAPLWARPLVAADALAFYLWKIVFPFNLTVDYARSPRYVLETTHLASWTWIVPLTLAAILAIRRSRMPIAGAVLFALGLLPVLGFTTFLFQRYSTVADRFVYLSMLGVALAAADALTHRWSRPVIGVCATIIVLLGVRSTVEALTWQNRATLYGHAVAVSPQSASAHSNYGIVLSNAGDAAGAEAEYRRAIAIDPDFLPAHYNLAGILRAQNRLDELEQERQIVERIKQKESAATQPAAGLE